MSQPRKRVRITPQKGINQVTQTSPAQRGDDDATLQPVLRSTSDVFQYSLLTSTVMEGRVKPRGLGISRLEQVSEIATPEGYAPFLVSDVEGSDKENEGTEEEECCSELNTTWCYAGASAAKGATTSVKLVDSIPKLEDKEQSFDTGISSQGSTTGSDLESAPNPNVNEDIAVENEFEVNRAGGAGAVQLLQPQFPVKTMFTRLKRKITLSLSESKFLQSSNSNTPIRPKGQLQTPSAQLTNNEDNKNHSIYARSVLLLRQSMSNALDVVAPRLRNGSPLMFITEELIYSIRQNVLKMGRDRIELKLCDKTFGTEDEYLAMNENISPGANEKNQCALCDTEGLSASDFANHKMKHIVIAASSDLTNDVAVPAPSSSKAKKVRFTPVRGQNITPTSKLSNI